MFDLNTSDPDALMEGILSQGIRNMQERGHNNFEVLMVLVYPENIYPNQIIPVMSMGMGAQDMKQAIKEVRKTMEEGDSILGRTLSQTSPLMLSIQFDAYRVPGMSLDEIVDKVDTLQWRFLAGDAKVRESLVSVFMFPTRTVVVSSDYLWTTTDGWEFKPPYKEEFALPTELPDTFSVEDLLKSPTTWWFKDLVW